MNEPRDEQKPAGQNSASPLCHAVGAEVLAVHVTRKEAEHFLETLYGGSGHCVYCDSVRDKLQKLFALATRPERHNAPHHRGTKARR